MNIISIQVEYEFQERVGTGLFQTM